MRKILSIFILAGFLILPFISFAQKDSLADKGQFKAGIFYNSALNYYGRTDSLRSSGVFPLAEIWFDKNFYINAAPVFVNNAVSHFDYAGTIVTGGYMFRDKKWAGNIYAVKPFYRQNSQLVQSALKWQGAASFTRLGKLLNMTIGGDIKYSDKMDYGAMAGLDHLFRFRAGNKINFILNPTATVNAGTQQFTETSYRKSGFLIFPEIFDQVSQNVKQFNILSYEFSAPAVMSLDNFQLILVPAYVIPQNLISVPNRPDLSERGKQMFYITAGTKVSF